MTFRESVSRRPSNLHAPSSVERATRRKEARSEPASVGHSQAENAWPDLDEALLEMERGRDYLVYRDAETDRLAVLVRRRDGHFDLVEA